MKSKEKALKRLNKQKNVSCPSIIVAESILLDFLSEIGHEDIVKEYREVIKKALNN